MTFLIKKDIICHSISYCTGIHIRHEGGKICNFRTFLETFLRKIISWSVTVYLSKGRLIKHKGYEFVLKFLWLPQPNNSLIYRDNE